MPDLIDKVRRNLKLLRSQIFPLETKWFPNPADRVVADGKIWALRPLFEMQSNTIEHSFPHEKAAIIDWILSDSIGDIYRAMCEIHPNYGYVMEKWTRVMKYVTRPPLSGLQSGDWDEIREQLMEPTYKLRRDKWLYDLAALRDATVKAAMDSEKRRAVMIATLDLQKATVYWFESLDPNNPPLIERDHLTGAIGDYFPRFWQE
jgi:hypothetical protein